MTVIIYNQNRKKFLFEYSDCSGDPLAIMRQNILSGTFSEGVTARGYQKVKIEGENHHYYLLEDVANNKRGKYQTKIAHEIMKKLGAYKVFRDEIESRIRDVSIHNTRNIHDYILERLKDSIDYQKMMFQDDKVEHIKDIIARDPHGLARDLLSTLKSLEQIVFEYDIIDFINASEPFDDRHFTTQRLHTVMLLCFYIYERDFIIKNIRVTIAETQKSISINFNTFRSAFALLLENCAKYCRPGTEVLIDYSQNSEWFKIDVEMESIYNTESEIHDIFLPGRRGSQAFQMNGNKGEGLGLYIARQLFWLNRIGVDFRLIERKQNNTLNGIEYSRNLFVIDVPAGRVL